VVVAAAVVAAEQQVADRLLPGGSDVPAGIFRHNRHDAIGSQRADPSTGRGEVTDMKLQTLLRKPIAAAVLSAIFPGAGQVAAGQRSRGAIVAIPTFGVISAALIILIFFRHQLLDSAFDTAWLTSLLFFIVLHLVYRVWAVVDSYLVAGREVSKEQRRRRSSNRKMGPAIGLAAIIVVLVGAHGALAAVDLGWQNGTSRMFGVAPAWAQTLAPGQTLAITTDNGDIVLDASGGPSGSAAPTATFDPKMTFDPGALPSSAIPVDANDWAADGQLNVLLTGIDAGTGGGRNQGLRPDTMMVLHVDIASGRAALIGIPRNTVCVPLPASIGQHYPAQGGCPAGSWPNMLNWLANEAGWNHPGNFPYDQDPTLAYTRAMTATEQAIGALTGLSIDGFVVINLQGLVTLIDDLHGIQINVPKAVSDYPCGPTGSWAAKWKVCDICGSGCSLDSRIHSGYALPDDTGTVVPHMKADAAKSNGMQEITWSQSGDIAFNIKSGSQHMDGDWALAYARTRIYTTDYDRMLRQQLVLKSMRTTLDPCTILPQVPGILTHLGDALWTNLPRTDASKWAGLAQHIFGGNIKSLTLDPGTLGTTSTYINPTTWAKAKDLVAHSLDSVPAGTSGGSSGGGGGLSC
jgi:anionic cell wall polymer biosynthesis LytR-Cps2A-Psr (LCP) family protein